MSIQSAKKIKIIATKPKIMSYIESQSKRKTSLSEVRESLSHISISLSERVKQDREKR